MQFLIFVLILSFFIFLFTLYFLANDDLVIIRKDMPMEKVFNTAFLTGLFALFFARFFYVIFYPREVFFNPLGFLLFPYFQGLSLLGAILGGGVFLYTYSKYQKLPVGRIFDFFAIALLNTLPIGFFGFFVLVGKSYFATFLFSFLIYIVLFIIFVKFLLHQSIRGKIKNGSLSVIFLLCFSIVTFLSESVLNLKNFKLFSIQNLITLSLFLGSIIYILKQEIIRKKRVAK